MADVSAPYTTAQELLSYHGDPALGYGGGINYSYNPTNQDPLRPFNQDLQKGLETTAQFNMAALQEKYKEKEMARQAEQRQRELEQQHQNEMQRMQYQAGVTKQNNMFEYLTKTGQSIFNQKDQNGNDMSIQPIPDDQKELQGMVGDAMKGVTGNPASYQYDPEVMSKAGEALSYSKLAQNRAFENTQLQLLAAQTDDLKEKQRIEDYRKENILDKKLTDNHWVMPYRPSAPLNYKAIDGLGDAALLAKDNKINYGEHYEQNQDGSVSKASYEGIDPRAVDKRDLWRSDGNQAARINKLVASELPRLTPERVQAINKVNDYVNEVNKWSQDDPHYIPHVEEAVKAGDPVNTFYAMHGGMLMQPTKITKVEKTKDEADKIRNDAQKQTEWESKQAASKSTVGQNVAELQKTFSAPLRGVNMALTHGDGKTENISTTWDKTPVLSAASTHPKDKVLYETLKKEGFDATGYRPVAVPVNKSLAEAAPTVYTYTKANSGSITPKPVKMPPVNVIQLLPADGDWQNSKIVYEMPQYNSSTGIKMADNKYVVMTPKEVALNSATDDVHKQFINEAVDNGWKAKSEPVEKAPPVEKPKTENKDEDFEVIRARLIPARAKRKSDGKEIEVLKDPKTKKLYPKDA